MRKNIPEKQWLLGLLALIAPQHEVFHKNYIPPKRNRGFELPQHMIPENGGFCNNLPELTVKELKKGGGINFLTKK